MSCGFNSILFQLLFFGQKMTFSENTEYTNNHKYNALCYYQF